MISGKYIIIITILFLVSNSWADLCTSQVCCDSSCSNCTTCIGDPYIDSLCCDVTILSSGLTCDSNPPPCILVVSASTSSSSTTGHSSTSGNTDTGSNDSYTLADFWSDVKTFFTVEMIIIISIGGLLLICIIYACTCFDNRKPPLDYETITWQEGMTWYKNE